MAPSGASNFKPRSTSLRRVIGAAHERDSEANRPRAELYAHEFTPAKNEGLIREALAQAASAAASVLARAKAASLSGSSKVGW
jgi:hypothetical protein